MLKPQFTVTAQEEKSDYGQFVIGPLELGYGQTVGNALRRCLLSSLLGAAVTEVEIDGVRHQFTTLSGMKEDIVELILNLKQLRIKYNGQEEVELKLEVKGPKKVTAADIRTPSGVTIVNKDLVLANLADKNSKLNLKMKVAVGLGYSFAEERKASTVGVIPLDAAFSPIRRVNYRVESTRVGRRTDFDKLIMDIWTDGTMEPKKALGEAAKILVSFFKQIYEPTFEKVEEKERVSLEDQEILNLTVEELDLPTRIANALRKGGYKTVKSLKKAKKSEIAQVKNLGGKSVDMVVNVLREKGINLED
ncbi:DNA-directed RNA polymerase subunit alpha [Candidatus Beckwithbacteria bacterium RBG_13_42_9]|uniref:DNA-directed RNA polymerase subunit alpha n=1 Tax=Candidatus Beckwithbacteria bacterium RBG_13_42_9 TaxID=1797457 RepID=A0A1F5E905_9BACT|nr:MAG: DNA-directed RNA polymerase subunit alpha [Candidatus Beckwithbacteria bacterium RBG_13_42_9]